MIMSDVLEHIEITVDGRPIHNFMDFSMTFGAEQAVRTATIAMGGPVEEDDFPFPDMPATITANGDLLLTGVVRDANPGHQDSDGGVIWSASITFVSKPVDTTESSIVHPSGEVRDKDLAEVARAIESAGVEWKSSGQLFDVPLHRVVPGRSAFREIEELARSRGILLYDDETGAINMAKGPAGRHAGGLELGVNLLSADAQLTGRYRHDPIIVRGQASTGSGDGALRPEAEVANPALGRRRPKVILFEGEPTMDALKGRAEQELTRREGRSKSASCEVPGWRDRAGEFWMSNYLVHLKDPLIFLDQDMLIKGGTFSQNDGGTRARLDLVDPRAMNGEDPKGEGDSFKVDKPKAKVAAKPASTGGALEPV